MNHIAFIMDGNGRWATKQGKPRDYGHNIGASKVYDTYKSCIDLGFKTVSFFAMSSENMSRSNSEIENIATLLDYSINKHFQDLIKNKIRFTVIGNTQTLPKDIKETIKNAEDATARFTNYKMNIAYNYGGKWDIVNAVNAAIAKDEEITPETVDKYLSTQLDFPDLIVRTGGYKRLSNFMLWQSAYSELVFLDTLWPDLTKNHIQSIFNQHVNTKRKFGIV